MQRKSDDLEIEAGVKATPFNFTGGTAVLPSREVQHAWFELTRARPWRSVALVPVEDNYSTLALAHEMAHMAALDPRNKVLVINASGIVGDSLSGGTGAMSGQVFGNNGAVAVANGKYWLLDCAKLGLDDATVGMVEVPKQIEQMRADNGTYTMIIVAANSLLSRPAAVGAARSVDTVVLCVTLGVSSFTSTKRTIELVGEENIAGTIAVRPRR